MTGHKIYHNSPGLESLISLALLLLATLLVLVMAQSLLLCYDSTVCR